MAVAKSGTCMTAARTPISDAEMPRPKSAMASGSPAATIEPKAMSSTIGRAEQAEALGPAAALRHADRAAAERDGQPVAAGALRQVDEPRPGRVGHVPHAAVELERGRGDRAVGRYADRTRGPDALQALGLGQEALHARPGLRRLRALRGLPDDADRVARSTGEVLREHGRSVLGLRALGGEVGLEGALQQRAEGEDGGQGGHPGQDDAPTVAMHEGAEPAKAAVVGAVGEVVVVHDHDAAAPRPSCRRARRGFAATQAGVVGRAAVYVAPRPGVTSPAS